MSLVKPVNRHVAAVLFKQNDEWGASSRYLTLESIALVSDNLTVKLLAVAAGEAGPDPTDAA